MFVVEKRYRVVNYIELFIYHEQRTNNNLNNTKLVKTPTLYTSKARQFTLIKAPAKIY